VKKIFVNGFILWIMSLNITDHPNPGHLQREQGVRR